VPGPGLADAGISGYGKDLGHCGGDWRWLTPAVVSGNLPTLRRTVALSYTLDPQARVVHVTYSGNPTFDEWAAMMLAIFREQQYAPGWGFLSDRRLVTEAPTKDYIVRAVAFVRSRQHELSCARWATVVSAPAANGMVRMGQTLAADLPLKTGVFTNLDEAREWLARGP
jgi:hypothetical protein